MSARYVAPGTYGVRDLDTYGTWRVVPIYGAVWIPTAVPGTSMFSVASGSIAGAMNAARAT